MNYNALKEVAKDINIKMQHYQSRPILSNFFMGLGIYHAVFTEDSYSQIPLAIFVPSGYIGYNTYKYFDKIKLNLSIHK